MGNGKAVEILLADLQCEKNELRHKMCSNLNAKFVNVHALFFNCIFLLSV